MKNAYQNKYCIVTGGAGFIGQHLVKALIEKGARVLVIDNFMYGSSKKSVHPKAIFLQGDVRDSKLYKKIPRKKYSYFFHFAAPSSTEVFKDNLQEATEITLNGFINAIHFSVQNKIRFIYPSSGSVYSGAKEPYRESSTISYENLNDYAKCKFIEEKIALLYRNELNSLGLRILAGYGPGESHKGDRSSVLYHFCRKLFDGKQPVIWGNGAQKRDFIYIDDIVNMILALSPTCPEPIINIGTGREISFNKAIDLINKELKIDTQPIYIKKPTLYLEKTKADTKILKKYYSQPSISIQKGIQLTLKSFKKSKI